MADHSGSFVMITLLTLLTFVLIAGMRYLTLAWQAKVQAAADTGVKSDLADIRLRLAAIEKVLREVE